MDQCLHTPNIKYLPKVHFFEQEILHISLSCLGYTNEPWSGEVTTVLHTHGLFYHKNFFIPLKLMHRSASAAAKCRGEVDFTLKKLLLE